MAVAKEREAELFKKSRRENGGFSLLFATFYYRFICDLGQFPPVKCLKPRHGTWVQVLW